MSNLKFSHQYTKFGGKMPKTAMLLQTFIKFTSRMSAAFIAYDTAYLEYGITKYYPLPEGKCIVLLLQQDGILFTTVRRWSDEKEKYYRSKEGTILNLEMTQGD